MGQKTQRIFYLIIGWFFTGLGFVGVFLPILPTTPFLLVAVWAFSKSSPKLKRWLFAHPKFGPHLHHWFKEGAIDRKAKILALSMMGLTMGFSMILSTNIYLIGVLGLIMSATATFIVTRPSPSPTVILEKPKVS